MPVEKRGFLFAYFDKIICGLVALGLIAGILYVAARARALPPELSVERLGRDADTIKRNLAATPQPPRVDVPQVSAARVFESVSVRRRVFVWPRPVYYQALKVAPNKEFILQFDAALGAGSLRVRPEGFLDILEHPVDSDYSKARMRSKAFIGECTVVGRAEDVLHIYPVIVDPAVDKTAYPPIDLAVSYQQGVAEIQFRPDPRIATEEVDVAAYEVWRRDWADPLGKFRFAAFVQPGPSTARAGSFPAATTTYRAAGRAPAGPTLPDLPPDMPPEMRAQILASMGAAPGAVTTAPSTATAPVGADTMTWEDPKSEPAHVYSYRVRTVGNNTFPTQGEFAGPIRVEVWPNVDFRFSAVGVGTGSVQFEVVKVDRDTQVVSSERFWVGLGDEIGGLKTDRMTGQVTSYLTGSIPVDYEPAAFRPDTGRSSARVIYADPSGSLRVLWQNETKAQTLWDLLRGAATGRTGYRTGP